MSICNVGRILCLVAIAWCSKAPLTLWAGDVPDVFVRNLDGKQINPFHQSKAARALVFVFVSNECPIANRYAPEIQRIEKKFGSKEFAFYLVHADPAETPAAIAQNTRDFRYTCPVLRDTEHRLVKLCGARVTPEAAVFLPSGELVY